MTCFLHSALCFRSFICVLSDTLLHSIIDLIPLCKYTTIYTSVFLLMKLVSIIWTILHWTFLYIYNSRFSSKRDSLWVVCLDIGFLSHFPLLRNYLFKSLVHFPTELFSLWIWKMFLVILDIRYYIHIYVHIYIQQISSDLCFASILFLFFWCTEVLNSM